MITQAVFYRQVMDSMEAMTDVITALEALSRLMAGCTKSDVPLSDLPYLLDPIIEKQKALVDELTNTSNVIQLDSKRSNK